MHKIHPFVVGIEQTGRLRRTGAWNSAALQVHQRHALTILLSAVPQELHVA